MCVCGGGGRSWSFADDWLCTSVEYLMSREVEIPPARRPLFADISSKVGEMMSYLTITTVDHAVDAVRDIKDTKCDGCVCRTGCGKWSTVMYCRSQAAVKLMRDASKFLVSVLRLFSCIYNFVIVIIMCT